MHLLLDFAISLILVALYKIYRRYSRISIAHIPGPKPESFLLGNLGELFQGQAAETDFKWEAQFGNVIRIKAPFSEDRLLIADPKALQYIYQTSGYNFPKTPDRREISRLVSGGGLLWADGGDHKRHRKVMLPAFGTPESKAFLPLFSTHAAEVTEKWKEIIGTSDQSIVLDIPGWISRATMDAIGEAAFDYHFGAMDRADNKLKAAYNNLVLDTFGSPSKARIFAQDICQYLHPRVLRFLIEHMPVGPFLRARRAGRVATGIAKTLLDDKSDSLANGRSGRDVMSLLVRANASESERTKLSEDEILAQMRTVILAGHETTSTTLSWTLLELSRHPEMQVKLRAEIRAMQATIHARGDTSFTTADFDNMPYLVAVIKESLRFHPVSYNNFRQAARNDVLPLSTPITTTTGDVISEIPIPAGLKVILSIAGYNRNKSIFGPDADTFNPERWLDGSVQKSGTTVGVYGNMLSFAGGVRSCIGWRFAVVELHAFLVELVGHFEFALTDDVIRREAATVVMIPTVAGQVEKGIQMPLRVSVAPQE